MEDVRTVKLLKGSSGLGFSIKGGKEHGLPIVISRIFEGGVADECGQLEVGHEIIAVNGESLENASHITAVQALKKAGSEVTLKVKLNLVLQGGLLKSSKDNLNAADKSASKSAAAAGGDDLGPLPEGWEEAVDESTGKKYYLDHNNEVTSWVDPRSRAKRKQDASECVGEELPFGWEKSYERDGTPFYINHNDRTTSWSHPAKK